MTILHHTQLPDRLDISESFRQVHYSPADLLELLGFDRYDDPAERFWTAYKSGRIPLGVMLPTTQPMMCWDRGVIHEWIAAGMPPTPGIEDHEAKVYAALFQAVEGTLPARPTTTEESN